MQKLQIFFAAHQLQQRIQKFLLGAGRITAALWDRKEIRWDINESTPTCEICLYSNQMSEFRSASRLALLLIKQILNGL